MKIAVFLLFWCFSFAQLYGQAINNRAGDVVMPSPNAASLGKYGDIPVSYNTGVPNIGVPIHTLTEGGISLPISLSYHAGGVKVGEPASWVGMGWSLSAGGMISRTVQGKPDEWATGYFSSGKNLKTEPVQQPLSNGTFITVECIKNSSDNTAPTNPDITGGGIDGEPDIFSFSIGAYTGKFYIDADKTANGIVDGKVVLIPQQDVKIEYYASPTVFGPRRLARFTLTTPEGIKYDFGSIDNSSEDADDAIEITNNNLIGSQINNFWQASGWYLKRITSADGTQSITLNYTKEEYGYAYKSSGHTEGLKWADATTLRYKENTVDVIGYRLNTIQTSTETATFVPSTADRKDLDVRAIKDNSTSSNAKFLSEIQITNSPYCKTFVLSQSYLYDYTDKQASGYRDYRLKLNSVQEKTCNSNNGTVVIPPYTFDYYKLTDTTNYYFPTRFSAAVDHWGYYNGATTNPTTGLNIPYTALGTYDNGGISVSPSLGSSNRETDEGKMKVGTLKQMTYPTGGNTLFEFEANSYFDDSGAGINKNVGGLRIKRITSSDGNNSANNVCKTYSYENNLIAGRSSGVLYNKQLVYGYIYSGYIGTCNGIPIPNTYYKNHFWLDNTIVPLGSFEGNHIAYSNVKEYYNANSDGYYTLYSYNNEVAAPFVGLPITPLIPRIGSGELITKTQRKKTSLVDIVIASETYNPKNDDFVDNIGTFIKTNTYFIGGEHNPGGTTNPITFWKSYKIPTRPYRLESVVTMKDDVVTTTAYEYNDNLLPKRCETVTNSNGTAIKTTYIYAKDHNMTELVNRNMVGFPVEVKVESGTSVKRTKIEYGFNPGSTTQYAPQYIKECLNNADSSVANNWVTRLYIESYTTNGMPSKIWRNNSLTAEEYEWTNKILTKKTYGTVANNILTWVLTLKTGTNLIETIKDENGLKKKFTYDGLMRLSKLQDRYNGTDAAPTNVQATIDYLYQYKDAVTASSYNTVQTTTTFSNGYPAAVGATLTPIVAQQYIDGLGRAVMSQRNSYTPTLQNLKNYVTYDALGRQNRTFEPVAQTSSGVDYADIPITASPPYSFVRTDYEASPLSRPIKQTMQDGRYVSTLYGTNATSEVRKFSVVCNSDGTNAVSPSGFYAANSLYKTVGLNENWNNNADATIGRTEIFKDKLGQVVATRKFVQNASNNWVNVDTYNVYDDFGKLVMVIPPDATSATVATDPINLSLVFQYNYDNRNRLIKKKVPNAAWQSFYYNNRDQLVLAQDGNMALTVEQGFPVGTKYMGTEYDELGRVVRTGFVSISGDPSVYLASNTVTIPTSTYLTQNEYYSNKTWVNFVYNRVITASDVTAPKATLRTEIDQVRPNLYNYKGFPYWVVQETLFGFDEMNHDYNGAGQPTYSNRYIFMGADANYSDFVHTWEVPTYDHSLRLTSSSHQMSNVVTSTNISTPNLNVMTYNYKDQLTLKKIGQTNGKYLQSIDYTYHPVRNWLTGIGSVNETGSDYPIFNNGADYYAYGSGTYPTAFGLPAPKPGEDNPDLFTESIAYDAPNTAIPGAQAAQYNGNISQIVWQVAGREKQVYSYKYDNLERLIEANYADIHNTTFASHGWSSMYKTDNKYQEKVSYDLRGNIQTLERNGLTANTMTYNGFLSGNFGKIDNLTYTYDPTDKNKLLSIADVSGSTKGFAQNVAGTVYNYDANGNLIMDLNKKISNIEYNYLNLPSRITFTKEITSGGMTTTVPSGIIEFMYNASGVKLQKTVIPHDLGGAPLPAIITNYSNGAEYDASNSLVRLQHTEGAVVNEGGVLAYEYVLRDHLGNNRVTFKANATGSLTATDVKQINHYQPFGLNMEGPGFGAQGANRYGYNAKELDSEFGLNWNDYGARFYDPAMARWLAVDPLAEKFYQWSPYNYGMNSPVMNIDPNGMSAMPGMEQTDAMTANAAMDRSIAQKAEVVDYMARKYIYATKHGGHWSRAAEAENDKAEEEEEQNKNQEFGEFHTIQSIEKGVIGDINWVEFAKVRDEVNAAGCDGCAPVTIEVMIPFYNHFSSRLIDNNSSKEALDLFHTNGMNKAEAKMKNADNETKAAFDIHRLGRGYGSVARPYIASDGSRSVGFPNVYPEYVKIFRATIESNFRKMNYLDKKRYNVIIRVFSDSDLTIRVSKPPRV